MNGPEAQGSALIATAKSLALIGGAMAAHAGRRAAAAAISYLIVASLFGASLCFLTLSGYRALSHVLGDAYAPLIVGTLYLILALAGALALQIRRR
jgi:hypothetical protein